MEHERCLMVPENLWETKSQPTYPKCANSMVLRVAERGNKTGEKIWGCSKFPACRSTLPIN